MSDEWHPVTPDGRYVVVRGKLWRLSNPDLGPREKSPLVQDLMDAHRAAKIAKAGGFTTFVSSKHLDFEVVESFR